MLVLDNVRYEYQDEWFVFELSVAQGSIVALMGPSGAGKSTLLSLVAGFIEPHSGDIHVQSNGEAVSVVGKAPYLRPFSMLFQEHNLFAHLSVRDNIGLGLHPGLKLSAAQREQVVRAANMVGVGDFLDRLPEQLSGGQRQRVALARCFVQPHPVWLLDEPFSALDPLLREEMLTLVKTLAAERSITVLMVTHHISDARAIATHFAFMAQGQVQRMEPIAALTAQHSYAPLAEFVRAGE
ncbi:thiamine ABC transporter ATP-binding protein [Vibrio fluvialis]|uniref:thiamine ABC transporter ATP-binding protein n=1 Tax=Vibrio fluvialis TaxID=676 RepID=UPI001C9CAA73|nr:thiamine ABC transporter ATP-binding protein [Vibrio fluvialis]EKO3381372.1 thiamine ABC transporter ATP-binding protein [Vibrio fluvialis]ELL4668426.1 thiamine ABC transporter ATP-binding protein [Vibrio fluvialis]MBY7836730.1 thiamine ABC transporter ATP-binding protein [Vibrio fluvialis]MBY7949563.1 thiamine ABC transporter ATP-binding protein [Vibrio fluvialis]MBY8012926.1 thiamine ABC transporter ATP-binding protein [Vibrio fluvialis]